MGLEMSKVNALIVGDTLDSRYDIYKIIDLYKNKQDNDYFKVNDLLDFNLKFVYIYLYIYLFLFHLRVLLKFNRLRPC